MADLKNRERFTTSIDKRLVDELKNLSKETDIPMSKLLDRAIRLLIEQEKGESKN